MNHPPLCDAAFKVKRKNFRSDFVWGISQSAAQTEGAALLYGRNESIWDEFAKKKNKIVNMETPAVATDFYHRYQTDINILKELGIKNFRFSISWSRILPNGTGQINYEGIDFYHRVIDTCLEAGIEPWVTLYHWDLPAALEKQGGWTNRMIISWFSEYVSVCIKAFKSKVKNWMVLNEPMVFTGAGYFLGIHAPGKKGLTNFLPAIHHTVMCQAVGGKIIRNLQPDANIGTTFSCSYISPISLSHKDSLAAKRIDALLNRLFIEPSLGLGYPTESLTLLKKLSPYIRKGDEEAMQFNFDFIGIQNYTREVVAHSVYVPYLQAKLIPASKRKVVRTNMNWEIYPESIYKMIQKFSKYKNVKKIIVTENGASFQDKLSKGTVIDTERINYLASYLEQVERASWTNEKLAGYFIWSLTDNFEWAEGFQQRFGLVYVDFVTQQRHLKKSALWYKEFLAS
jgi:beta-glucosidase